jgi:tetratricopeptide (TPR) repeat protein
LQLHQQVAEALEEIYASDPAPHLSKLAHHYSEVTGLGISTKAIEYSIRAGEVALAVFAYEETIAHWKTALELMERRGGIDEQCAGLYYRLGRLMSTIDRANGTAYLEKALTLYKHLGQPLAMAQVHVSLGNFMSALTAEMDIRQALEHYRKSEALVEQGTPTESTARLAIVTKSGLASAAARALHIREGLTASHRAMENSRGLRGPRTACEGEHTIQSAFISRGSPARSLRAY